MEKLNTNLLMNEAKKYISEILAGSYIFIIIMLAFIFQKFKIIAFLSCIIILFVGIEKHATVPDRCFAISICFILALGFMFL